MGRQAARRGPGHLGVRAWRCHNYGDNLVCAAGSGTSGGRPDSGSVVHYHESRACPLSIRCGENPEEHVVHIGQGLDVDVTAKLTDSRLA
jgi:hypothetical protein